MGQASRKKAARRQAERETAHAPEPAGPRSSSTWKLVAAGALVLVIGALVALLALSSSETGSGGSQSLSGAAASRSAAPEFTVPTIAGKSFSLADQRGKTVIVEFLQPGCPSCGADVAGLSRVAVQSKGDVVIVINDVGGLDDSSLRGYYRGEFDAAPEIRIANDSEFQVAQAYGVNKLGQTVVIDGEGRIVWEGIWAGDESRLFDEIERAATT